MTFVKWNKVVYNQPGRRKSKLPSITEKGSIHLILTILNELFTSSEFAEVFFDEERSLLGIKPAEDSNNGTNYRVTRWKRRAVGGKSYDYSNRGAYVSCISPLRKFNILRPQRHIPYRIENGMLILEVKRNND